MRITLLSKCISLSLLTLLLMACGPVHNATPSAIGLLPLSGYQLKTNPSTTNIEYRVIRSDEDFNASFQATAENSRKPAFNGQTVVAILLTKIPEQGALQFQKADITGTTMNVYAQKCIPGTPDCIPAQAVLATTPKSGNVKRVQFFINGESRATVVLPNYTLSGKR